MRHLIQSISNHKPVVVWNPFKDNDGLSREDFINLVTENDYCFLVYQREWLMAYQPGIQDGGYNTIDKYVEEATKKNLIRYRDLLESDLELISNQHYTLLRKQRRA